ncbi:MAG: sulfotransferase [Desulfobacteraceae bacterium]|nr:MAG: sulfotransferase [Desulfobacteraceae bacterium]
MIDNKEKMISPAPFFVIGAQRSGTTLLRLMLNSHPDVAIPEEGTFWMPLLRSYGKNPQAPIQKAVLQNYLRYISKNSQFKLWLLDDSVIREKALSMERITLSHLMSLYYDAYAQVQGKMQIGDKTPSFFRMVPVLSNLFPQAKFIHIVRDGRDIYLSLRKMGRKDNISVGALEWAFKVLKAQRDLAKIDPVRVLQLRYEDLLAAPGSKLEEICAFLHVTYDSAMLDFWKTSHNYIGCHHSQYIFEPVASDNIKKWKNRLSSVEVAKFQRIAGTQLGRMRYELDSAVPQVWNSSILFDLAYGLPCRITKVILTAIQLKITARFGLRTDAAGKGILPDNNQAS